MVGVVNSLWHCSFVLPDPSDAGKCAYAASNDTIGTVVKTAEIQPDDMSQLWVEEPADGPGGGISYIKSCRPDGVYLGASHADQVPGNFLSLAS